METFTITRKIELRVLGDTSEKSRAWERLREIDQLNYQAANHLISNLYMLTGLEKLLVNSKYLPREFDKLDKKEKVQVRKDARKEVSDLLKSKTTGYNYRDLAHSFPNLPSVILAGIERQVESIFQTKYLDIMMGKCALPSFKKGLPIYFKKTKLNFKENEENNFNLNFLEKIQFSTVLGRDRSNNKSIIEKCISEVYKVGDSTIKIDGNKIFLFLVLQIPKEVVHLDSEIIVGVDLGLSFTAIAAVNKNLKRMYVDNSILKPRLRLQRQKQSLQKELKYVKGGRGRNKKLSRLDKVKKAESNFVKTANHKISEEIVHFALKNNAYKINLENLEGFSKNQRDSFVLRNWSYFELQTMIEYKANKYGIIVEKVSPSYTSQVCNCCGTKGERVTQSEFTCKNNKCKETNINADYNAAKNIANGGVGLTYNKETKLFFESLDYGEVVLPEAEGLTTR